MPIKGQHSQVTQEQYDSFQERHAKNKEFEAQKTSGLTEYNLTINHSNPVDLDERRKAELAREKEIRPNNWQSSNATQARNAAYEEAQKRQAKREEELRKAHLLTARIPLMWKQEVNEITPNIYLMLIPECGIDTKLSGAFNSPSMLQQWLDMKSQEVYKKILAELNGMKKLTDRQKELSKKLQELIIETK